MGATLIRRTRVVFAEKAFAELVVWRVTTPIAGSVHRFKYRLAYIVNEVCVLRYDNERGKGDHRHYGREETAYAFTTPQALLADFERDIERWNTMKTVILDVRDPLQVMTSFERNWVSGDADGSERISFASPELLWKVLTARRWALLKVLCGAGPISIRELARRTDRDVKALDGDVTALIRAGVVNCVAGGGVVFPYDAIKVEFLLQAA